MSSEKGYVYIAEIENNTDSKYPSKYYKVGYSNNPDRRMAELKNNTNILHKIVKIYEFENYKLLETVSHKYLVDYNIYGEYFNASLEIIQGIIEKAINDIINCDYEPIKNEFSPKSPATKLINNLNNHIDEFKELIRAEHLKELQEKYIFVEKDGNIEGKN